MAEKSKASNRPYRKGPSAVSSVLGDAARAALKRFGFQGTQILTHWPEIAGPRLATRTRPLRLSRDGKGGMSLTLLVEGAAALEVQHQGPQILSRVQTYFGGPALSSLKIVQGQIPAPPPLPEQDDFEPDAETLRRVQERAAGIKDEVLRAQIVALGTRILLRTRHDLD